jgi:hypothetical protein
VARELHANEVKYVTYGFNELPQQMLGVKMRLIQEDV